MAWRRKRLGQPAADFGFFSRIVTRLILTSRSGLKFGWELRMELGARESCWTTSSPRTTWPSAVTCPVQDGCGLSMITKVEPFAGGAARIGRITTVPATSGSEVVVITGPR